MIMISPKTCTVTSQGLQSNCNSSQIPSSEVVNSCLNVLAHRIMRLWLSKDRYDTRNLLIIFIPLTFLNLNQETTWTHSTNESRFSYVIEDCQLVQISRTSQTVE